MSGIVGILNTDGGPLNRELLRKLTTSLTYRGPDAQALWIDGHVGFGHAMLRTTDESLSERQPMSLDGGVWITADARVDGRDNLLRELGGEGASCPDVVTDVELILRAYHRWDTACVDHLLGDYAFAIWDRRSRRLFCARDPFGVKPFFYAQVGNVFTFGNTLNCLRLHPAVRDTLNDIAVGDFLLFGSNYDASTTTFADVRRLPGGHCLTLSHGRIDVRRYWSLPIDGHIRHKRPAEYVDQFKDILHTAVTDRLRVSRVAAEMSGGLDSTAIAATAKGILAKRGGRFDIQAYTCVFDRLIADRERHFSGVVAEALDIPIHYVALDDFPLFEPPVAGDVREPEPFYSYPRSTAGADFWALAATRSRVLLTGWDGDALMSESPAHYFRRLFAHNKFAELVAGWAWFIGVQHALPPMGLRTWFKRKLGTYPARSAYPTWVNPEFANRIDLPARWKELNAESRPLHPTRPLTSTMLQVPNWWSLFEAYDPGVRGLALEARHPLIDCRLVNYVLAIPPVPWSIDKHILRESMSGTLPDVTRLRPKSSLNGDPALELVRGVAHHPIDDFVPLDRLANYVVRDAIPRVAGEASSERLWLNVRPYVLNRWLANMAHRVAATDASNDSDVAEGYFDAA